MQLGDLRQYIMETANYLMGDLLTSICPAVNYFITTCLHFMEVRQPVSTLTSGRCNMRHARTTTHVYRPNVYMHTRSDAHGYYAHTN